MKTDNAPQNRVASAAPRHYGLPAACRSMERRARLGDDFIAEMQSRTAFCAV